MLFGFLERELWVEREKRGYKSGVSTRWGTSVKKWPKRALNVTSPPPHHRNPV